MRSFTQAFFIIIMIDENKIFLLGEEWLNATLHSPLTDIICVKIQMNLTNLCFHNYKWIYIKGVDFCYSCCEILCFIGLLNWCWNKLLLLLYLKLYLAWKIVPNCMLVQRSMQFWKILSILPPYKIRKRIAGACYKWKIFMRKEHIWMG